jgi:hypothetical protein
MSTWRGRAFLVGLIIAGAAVAFWLTRPGARSYFRDVAEPITIAYAMSFDDGGSQGLRFKDARGVERDVCMEETLDDRHTLLLDSFIPDGKSARRVPISGAEERALLGLLERWTHGDATARELDHRSDLYERGAIDDDAFWRDLPDDCRVKQTAVNILRRLRARN